MGLPTRFQRAEEGSRGGRAGDRGDAHDYWKQQFTTIVQMEESGPERRGAELSQGR